MSHSHPSLVLALSVVMLAPVGASAADEAQPSDPPVVLEPEPGSLIHDAPTDSTPIEPDASIIDAAPVPWERLEIGPGGQSMRVVFWSGAPECYGLARVDAAHNDGAPLVTVWMGLRPEAVDRPCPAMAQLYHVDITLDEPFVRDGGTAEGPVSAPAMGPGIGIGDIDEAPAGEILLVNGSLVVGPDGEVRLWEALAESYPPQGAGRSLLVKGLDDHEIDWTEAQGVRWVERVQLLGRVQDGTLVVDPLAR